MTTKQTIQHQWQLVSPYPSEHEILIPTGITKEDYIGVSQDDIFRYNFETDNWNKVMDMPDTISFVIEEAYGAGIICAIDKDKKDLWIFDEIDLTRIKLHGNVNCDYNVVRSERGIGVIGRGVFINTKFHIISGGGNNYISRWDNKQFTNIIEMHNKTRLAYFGLIHHKNGLFIIGGYDYSQHQYMDSILEYNISENKWYKMPVSLPNAMWECACTMAIRNKYILIFGGRNDDVEGFDDILVYSVKHKTIKVSKVKSPSVWGIYKSAITVNDIDKDEKIVFGYVRETWKSVAMGDYIFLPYYLLKLIHGLYLNEYVYLLEKYNGNKHWKMSTLDIVG